MKHNLLGLLAICMACTTLAQQRPSLSSWTPNTGVTAVLTTVPLSLSFDKAVTKGSGKIYLRNRSQKTTLTIPASSSTVSVSGNLVLISGLGLQAGTYYHVTFDSTAFDSASYHCTGLYDTSTWWFRTGGTGVGVGEVATSGLAINLVSPVTNGQFVLSGILPQATIISIHVYDIQGRELAYRSFAANKGNNRFPLQTDVPPGNYILRIDDGKAWKIVRSTMQ